MIDWSVRCNRNEAEHSKAEGFGRADALHGGDLECGRIGDLQDAGELRGGMRAAFSFFQELLAWAWHQF